MIYKLREYQLQAVEKALWSRQLEGGDLIVLPTGSGKSLVIAELAKRLDEDILILQPTREILQQNFDKLSNYVPFDEIGIYSASFNKKIIKKYTLATIQSIFRKPEFFAHFKTVIVDECHLVNPKNLSGMYTQFFEKMGKPKVYGMSASPYRLMQMYERLSNGGILTHTTTKLINRLKERFWHRIMFNINIGDLIAQKYLVPLRYIDKTIFEHDEIPTNKSGSDFDLEAFEQKIKEKDNDVIESICLGTELGKHVLVFCPNVSQAEKLAGIIPNSAVVTANTNKKNREKIIADFRSGEIQVVFNVGVLTTGFDFPELDVIVLLRPTQSIALYNQMLGRGVRPFKDKKYCFVIDMTGTVKVMGRIETMKLDKVDGKWEILSETGSWHYKILYSHLLESKPAQVDDPIPF